MIHLLVASWWYWHPLAEGHGSTCSASDHSGCGYAAWSGWVSDVGEVTIATAILASLGAWWRKHNCHVQRCWRLQWHPHPGHGHPVCTKHHPSGQGRGRHLSAAEHSLERHLEILAERYPDPPAPTPITARPKTKPGRTTKT